MAQRCCGTAAAPGACCSPYTSCCAVTVATVVRTWYCSALVLDQDCFRHSTQQTSLLWQHGSDRSNIEDLPATSWAQNVCHNGCRDT
jgi:hypothetical protein